MAGPSSSEEAAAIPLPLPHTSAANEDTPAGCVANEDTSAASSTVQSPLMHCPPSDAEDSTPEVNDDPVVVKSINTRSLNKNMFTPQYHAKKDSAGRISDKLCAACWVCAGIGTGYFSKFWHVMTLQDDRIILYLYIPAMVLLAANTVMALYLALYVPRLLELNLSDKDGPSVSTAWKAYCPKIIPIMGVNAVLFVFFMVHATFPIWHFLSPLILAVEFISVLFSTHFIPWW